ncbi:hypothetical protein M5K25_015550 [Dendrobium thyrsiflorum]|uniref:Uncharacterized protein n=1 Tax=Dendrobium thyrsiflorum TaxID=117978 RepID=A0ABD0UR32_DENTH
MRKISFSIVSKALSILIASNAEVSRNESPSFSAINCASSVEIALKCFRSDLLPAIIITMLESAWSLSSRSHLWILPLSDVINEKGSNCTSVVGTGDGSIPFLASSVPYLSLNHLPFYLLGRVSVKGKLNAQLGVQNHVMLTHIIPELLQYNSLLINFKYIKMSHSLYYPRDGLRSQTFQYSCIRNQEAQTHGFVEEEAIKVKSDDTLTAQNDGSQAIVCKEFNKSLRNETIKPNLSSEEVNPSCSEHFQERRSKGRKSHLKRFCGEFHTDRGFGIQGELVPGKPRQYVGFSNTGVTYKHDLEEIIIFMIYFVCHSSSSYCSTSCPICIMPK